MTPPSFELHEALADEDVQMVDELPPADVCKPLEFPQVMAWVAEDLPEEDLPDQ